MSTTAKDVVVIAEAQPTAAARDRHDGNNAMTSRSQQDGQTVSSGGTDTQGSLSCTRHSISRRHILTDAMSQRKHAVPVPPPTVPLGGSATIRRWVTPDRPPAGADVPGTIGDEGGRGADDEADASPDRWARELCGCSGKRSAKVRVQAFFPMLAWLSSYQWRAHLPTDVVAGLTVGIMIIPQSMSYAKLAGLPVQVGLYSSLVPIYAYAVSLVFRRAARGPRSLPVARGSRVVGRRCCCLLRRTRRAPRGPEPSSIVGRDHAFPVLVGPAHRALWEGFHPPGSHLCVIEMNFQKAQPGSTTGCHFGGTGNRGVLLIMRPLGQGLENPHALAQCSTSHDAGFGWITGAMSP